MFYFFLHTFCDYNRAIAYIPLTVMAVPASVLTVSNLAIFSFSIFFIFIDFFTIFVDDNDATLLIVF